MNVVEFRCWKSWTQGRGNPHVKVLSTATATIQGFGETFMRILLPLRLRSARPDDFLGNSAEWNTPALLHGGDGLLCRFFSRLNGLFSDARLSSWRDSQVYLQSRYGKIAKNENPRRAMAKKFPSPAERRNRPPRMI